MEPPDPHADCPTPLVWGGTVWLCNDHFPPQEVQKNRTAPTAAPVPVRVIPEPTPADPAHERTVEVGLLTRERNALQAELGRLRPVEAENARLGAALRAATKENTAMQADGGQRFTAVIAEGLAHQSEIVRLRELLDANSIDWKTELEQRPELDAARARLDKELAAAAAAGDPQPGPLPGYASEVLADADAVDAAPAGDAPAGDAPAGDAAVRTGDRDSPSPTPTADAAAAAAADTAADAAAGFGPPGDAPAGETS